MDILEHSDDTIMSAFVALPPDAFERISQVVHRIEGIVIIVFIIIVTQVVHKLESIFVIIIVIAIIFVIVIVFVIVICNCIFQI